VKNSKNGAGPSGSKRIRAALLYAALPLLIIFVWWLFSALEISNPYLVPAPQKMIAAFWRLVKSGELARHILISLGRVWAGFALSAGTALLLALLFHQSPALKKIFHVPFEILRAIPPLAMIPLLILWFGIGEGSKLAVIVLATFFPVFLSALGGFDSLDGRWQELADSLELSFSRRLRGILIPAALPEIITGLRLGFGYAWRALLGAELFSSSAGLGYLITDAQQMARIDVVFAGILVIGLLGLSFDALFRFIVKKSSPATDMNWGSDA
jgi:NitT/TauT family transport system permease protein/sulfonate transport system permease protein